MNTCPNDGGVLSAIDAEGAPPWLCAECARAWEDEELTTEARRLWNHVNRDYGTSPESHALYKRLRENKRKKKG